MTARRRSSAHPSPAGALETLVQRALDLAKKARKHKQNLAGDTFYGNKLAEMRADATNVFRDLSSQSAGDISAMAELIEAAFAATTPRPDRIAAARELIFSLRTTWRDTSPSLRKEESFFPLTLLVQAKRGYLVTVGRQMNGCYSAGWFDACAVMMRRLVEIAIIEAFEAKHIASKIKDASGNYVHLSNLVDQALNESTWSLSRNTRKYLPQVRDVGHMSAHGRYYCARAEDIERIKVSCRVIVEEFLHHAGLL
jgi:hypothetical protein